MRPGSSPNSPSARPPAVLAYCEDPRHGLLLAGLVPSPTVVREWRAIEHGAQNAGAIVLVVESLVKWPHLEAFRLLRRKSLGVPWILVTSVSETNLQELGKIEVDEVIPIHRPEPLREILPKVRVRALRAAMADALSKVEGLDLHTRDLLRALFLASTPPRNCDEWAAAANKKTSTLRHRMGISRRRGGPGALLAVNTNLLLSALEDSPTARTWSALAVAVDTGEGRLERTAAILLPRSAGKPDPAELMRAFLSLVERSTDGVGPRSARQDPEQEL